MPASVCSITPTPNTTAAPITPLYMVVLAASALSASPRAAIYIVPPQIMNMTAMTTETIIKNWATFSTNCWISSRSIASVVGSPTGGVGVVSANTKTGVNITAMANTANVVLIILLIHPPPFLNIIYYTSSYD